MRVLPGTLCVPDQRQCVTSVLSERACVIVSAVSQSRDARVGVYGLGAGGDLMPGTLLEGRHSDVRSVYVSVCEPERVK